MRQSTPPEGPLYRQVRERILKRIVAGDWPAGTRLPSEWDLADMFGVSQGTARKALETLATDNLIVRHQGRGTFVASHSPQRELFHFFPIEGADGTRRLPTTGRLIGITNRRASRLEAKRLDLAANAHVIDIRRVRDLAGRPVIVEQFVVAAKSFAGLGQDDDLPSELYTYYEQAYGITVHRAVEQLRAVAADRTSARWLGLPVGAPLLEIERLAETADGTPVEWRRSRCDTGQHHYLSEIV